MQLINPTPREAKNALRKKGFLIIAERSRQDLLTTLAGALNLHPLTVEDIAQPAQVKVEFFDTYTYLGLAIPIKNKQWRMLDIDSIITPRGVILFFQHIPQEIEEYVKRHVQKEKEGWMILYTLLDMLLESYSHFTEEMMKAYERVEKRIFTGTVKLEELLTVKNHLLLVKRYATTLRDRIGMLIHHLPEKAQPYYRDVHDQLIHTVDSLDYAIQLAGSSIDIYLSEINNRTNDVMRVLTVVSTIFLPLTLIAGIYGMNFKHMPELSWQYGYYATLTLMLIIALSLLAYFKKRGWV